VNDPDRRKFLARMAAASLFPGVGDAMAMTANPEMEYRELGKTGQKVSCIGLGGYHLGQSHVEEADALRIFDAAIERGINFSDNSWDYNQGVSEQRVGKALKGRRDKIFVMTKYDGRTKGSALKQLDESLQRLETDYIDLWQFHENIRLEDPDRFFAEGGAVEAVQEAKKSGKIRFAGFTGHKDPSVHLRMLDLADKHRFTFDTVQMPLNVMDAHFRSFGRQVLPVLNQKKIGVLGMKPIGSGNIIKSKTVTALECLQYALHLPVSVVITGIDSMPILDQAVEAARSFRQLSALDFDDMLKKTAPLAADGKFEPFKTSAEFDSTAAHPEWLGYSAKS
jgi:predicted aldo/keto reductase-like oxidoreductase